MNRTPVPPSAKPKLNIIERMNEIFGQALVTRPFPMENVSWNWFRSAVNALGCASPVSMNISSEQFAKLLKLEAACQIPQLTMFQFACLSNNLESKSPKDLGLSFEQYGELLAESTINVEVYNGMIAELRKESETTAANESIEEKTADGALKAIKD